MKKFFMLLALIVVSFSFVMGAELGKLTIWCSEVQVSILQKLGDEFEAQYGIPVTVQQVTFGDIRSKFLTAAPAGEGPDIIVGAHDWVGELAANGLLLPLDFFGSEQRKGYVESALKGFEYGGKLYGLPYGSEAVALIYNKELVPTPPTTWEELVKIAKDLTDGDLRGFVFDAGNFYFAAPILFAAGGYVFKETPQGLDANDIGLANEGAIKGGNIIKKLYDEGIMKPGDNSQIMDSLFKDGLAGMIISGPWAIKDIQAAGIDYGVAPIPGFAGTNAKPFIGVQGFMLNSKSPNYIFALEFLSNFLNQKEIMYKLYQADPRVPTRTDVLELVKDQPDVVAFANSASRGTPMPNIPAMNAVWSAMAGALTQIINDLATPEQALKEAVDKIKLALGQ